MSTFCIHYFHISCKSRKCILRIWWASCRSSTTIKNVSSPMQCFFCKLVQMPKFGRLKSANGNVLNRLFPNLWQIPQLHLAYMVGIMSELNYHQKYFLSNAVLFLEIGANAQVWLVKISKWAPFA